MLSKYEALFIFSGSVKEEALDNVIAASTAHPWRRSPTAPWCSCWQGHRSTDVGIQNSGRSWYETKR